MIIYRLQGYFPKGCDPWVVTHRMGLITYECFATLISQVCFKKTHPAVKCSHIFDENTVQGKNVLLLHVFLLD